MRRFLRFLFIAVVVEGLLLGTCMRIDAWTTHFEIDESELVSIGRNPYFILEPGYSLVLEGSNGQLTITVLAETKKVHGVETRVVEEREIKDGKLVEVSRNYFAMSRRTSDVFYFGEEVDNYKEGQIVNHDGTWLAGVGDARFGLMMPGTYSLNASYYQEMAPAIAMDRAKIVSLTETVRTPAGEFTNCLKVEETTPLQPQVTEFKYHARGVGLVKDGELQLVKIGKRDGPKP